MEIRMHISRVCKLYPSKKDVTLLNHWLEESLEVYNKYSRERILLFNNREHIPSVYSLKKDLTILKKETGKFHDISRTILDNTLFKLDEAWLSFWAKIKNKDYKAKPPRPRKHWNILNFNNGFKIQNNNLFISEIGKGKKRYLTIIPFRQNDLLPEKYRIGEITIKRVRSEWFLHLTYNIPDEFLEKTTSKEYVAFDWGISTFLTDHNGNHVDEQKFISAREKKHIANLQRKQRNQKRGSKRYQKSQDRINKIREVERKRKKDHYYKLSLNMVSNFGTICIEDLTLSDLRTKEKHHGRSMNRQSPSIFFNCIKHQAKKHDCNLIFVDAHYTSMTCNTCGYVKEDMTQQDREWDCPDCGSHHNRDHNGAKNILLLAKYVTSGIGGSAREVNNLAPQIGDCFQSFRDGIKREEVESFNFERH